MELRPRQKEAFDAVFSALDRGVDKVLLSIPTGVGKTAIGCHVAKEFDNALFLVHRTELMTQTAAAMSRVDPGRVQGFIAPGQHSTDAPFTIAMLPTIYRRLERIPQDTFDAVIFDECHHATSKSWRAVADHFAGAKLRLGLSATPERTDGSDLSHLFSEIAYSMTVEEAVNEGYLVPPIARQCLTSCNLSNVKTVGGDFNEGQLAAVVDCEERNAFVVEKYVQYATGRRAIAFTVTIDHARNLAAAFQAERINADWVTGDSPDRSEKLAAFAKGEIKVLASCMVLSEGFDDPGVDCILLCRPTKSKSLFTQMCGRGLRLNDGKQDCLIIDFTDNAGRHSLASVWKWMGYTKQPKDDELLEIGKEKQERESRVIAVDADRSINLLLPPPELPAGFAYGQHAWHFEPPTERQLAFLEQLGYNVRDNDFSRGQASAIISAQPPSAAQLRLLANLGYDVNQPWTRGQASAAFEESKTKALALVKKIRNAGFHVEAQGHTLRIEPYGRLSPVQRDWVSRNKSGLLLALRE